MSDQQNLFIATQFECVNLSLAKNIDQFEFDSISQEDITQFCLNRNYITEEEMMSIPIESNDGRYEDGEEFNNWCMDLEEKYRNEYWISIIESAGKVCAYYFPKTVEFQFIDQDDCAEGIILGYNTKKKQWCVIVANGGRDMSPDLLDTFIDLAKGVPLEIAEAVEFEANGNIKLKRHIYNCSLLAKAYQKYADSFNQKANKLLVQY